MSTHTIASLSAAIGGAVEGDGATPIADVKPIAEAGSADITFVANARYAKDLETTKAACAVIPKDMARPASGGPAAVIRHDAPYVAFAKLIELLRPQPPRPPAGVHASAVVSPEAKVAPDASVGPGAVIEAGAEIGPRAVVGALCFVGAGAVVGEETRLYPRAVLYHGVRLGKRCIVHSGAVIGADGFGYASDRKGVHHKIPQVGTTILEDDVEVGANTTIDRAVLGATRIGRGTKIDNLVMVAHNVEVGPGSILIAQCGIAGSTKLGHHVVVAAQAGLVGHIEVGDMAQIGAQSGVPKDVPAGAKVLGAPALPARDAIRNFMLIERLPELRKSLDDLEKRVTALEAPKA